MYPLIFKVSFELLTIIILNSTLVKTILVSWSYILIVKIYTLQKLIIVASYKSI